MRDNGFNKVCPSGNSMVDCPSPEEKDIDDYPSEQENKDMEEYYEKKYNRKE